MEFDAGLIAPCGMDCALCRAHQRDKRRCPGCNGADADKPGYCTACRIRTCEELRSHECAWCFECAKFPCVRLRQLDHRYRMRYGMSMIENLESIRDAGLEAFVAAEKSRWACPGCGATLCVHKPECVHCGRPRT